MIKRLLSFLLVSLSQTLTAQITPTTQWAWMKGDNVLDQPGQYGTQGTFSTTNTPGSRDGVVSWKDAGGNFWIFGGNGYSSGPRGLLNDLWKYDRNLGQWQWVNGSNLTDDPGDMSVFGTPDASIQPGARRYATSWTDQVGRLWLFGGEGYTPNGFGQLNDLWMFDPVSNLWTWVGGSENPDQFTEFGVQGLPDPGNMPGSRYGAGGWVDNAGDLWLFGGLSFDFPTPSYSNELWHYDIVSGEWTWITGNFILNTAGTYGTQGTPSASNTPGGRMDVATWTDNSGDLWMLGGFGLDLNSGEGAMNDLWRFNIGSGNWTWMKGDNVVNQVGIYGTQGTAGVNTTPGARFQAYSWKDAFGTFWLYGGDGYGTTSQGLLSDLWKYDLTTNRWTWTKGDGVIDRSSVYGSQGVASPAARPGGRRSGGVFSDAAGNIWLFGGNGFDASTNTDLLNDLWRLGSFTVVPVGSISLMARIHNNQVILNWHTLNELNTERFTIERSADGFIFVELTSGNTTGTNSGRSDYLNHDVSPLQGLSYYRVKIIDQDGRISFSNVAAVLNSEIEFSVFPNPASDHVFIKSGGTGVYRVDLFDINGRVLRSATGINSQLLRFDLPGILPGSYVLKFNNGTAAQKIIILVK